MLRTTPASRLLLTICFAAVFLSSANHLDAAEPGERLKNDRDVEDLPNHVAERPAPTRNLRVLAYNVKHGRGNDGKVDLERTARVIRRLNPDVVALQEIDNKATRSGKVDEAKRLGELTGLKHGPRTLLGLVHSGQGRRSFHVLIGRTENRNRLHSAPP